MVSMRRVGCCIVRSDARFVKLVGLLFTGGIWGLSVRDVGVASSNHLPSCFRCQVTPAQLVRVRKWRWVEALKTCDQDSAEEL